MNQVIVTGSLAFDYIMNFPDTFEKHIIPEKLKTLSVSFDLNRMSKNFGGNAGNIAYTFSLLGQKSSILSSGGSNDFKPYLKHLQKHAIDTSHINLVKNDFTANAFAMTDQNNCQIWGFYPGAVKENKNLSITSYTDIKEYGLLIIAPAISESLVNFAKQAKKLRLPFIFSPGQELLNMHKDQVLEGIEGSLFFIVNDYELALVSQKTGLTKKDILTKTKFLVTTLGDQGSTIETKEKQVKIGIVKPTKVVDPTGAGDAYIAGLITGYLKDLPPQICGQIGATAATYAIEEYGTQSHTFSKRQFEKRYKESFGKKITL